MVVKDFTYIIIKMVEIETLTLKILRLINNYTFCC